MTDTLSAAMRKPRQAKARASAVQAWWYIDPGGIEIYVEVKGKDGNVAIARLTQRQLRRALAVMEEVEE